MDVSLNLALGLFKTLILGSLFAYTMYPLAPAMVVSNVCRLPKIARPRMCQPEDVSNFELGSLFQASAESARIVAHIHGRICNGDTVLPLRMLDILGQHDNWTIPDQIHEAYSSRTQIDALLRQEVRRSQLSHRAISSLNGLCRSLAEGRDTAMRQNRDLVRSLYQTTGTETQMFQRINAIPVSSSRVNDLADAFLAPVDTTFAKWGEFRAHLTMIRRALVTLEKANEKMAVIAQRAHSIVRQDLDTEIGIANGISQTLPTLWNRFWYPPGSQQELKDLVASLDRVHWTAMCGRRDISIIEVSDLAPFSAALNKLESKYGHLRDITKPKLVRDWELHQPDIVNAAARWRQHLVGRYDTRTWKWLWFASDREETDNDLLDFLQMIFEPVVHGATFSVGLQLLPAHQHVTQLAAWAFILGTLVVCAKFTEDALPLLNLSMGQTILWGIACLLAAFHDYLRDLA